MSTTHYSPSASAADTERYIRGKEDERGIAITCDVPGGPGAFSARARSLTQNTTREVEAVHYRQSFSDEEFDPKSPEDVQRVNDLGLVITISKEAKDFIIEKGYDPQYGARPLKRAIQKYLEDELAEVIIKGIAEGTELDVGYDKENDKLIITEKENK